MDRDTDGAASAAGTAVPDTIRVYKLFVGAWVPNWLMERREISPGAKLTYGRLAQYAGKDGDCKPRQAELANEVGVTPRQARRYLDELQAHQLIREHRMGRGQANRYEFLKHPWMARASDWTHPSTQADDRTDPSSHPAVEWTHLSGPEWTHLSGPIEERKESVEEKDLLLPLPPHANGAQALPGLSVASPPKAAQPGGPVKQVFEAWQESTGKHRAKLDDKRTRVIKNALKAYPLADVLDAVRGWQHSPHHRGQNSRHTVYNDLQLLLRDADHIERFRDLQRDADAPGPTLPPPIVPEEPPLRPRGKAGRQMQEIADIHAAMRRMRPPGGTPDADDLGRVDGHCRETERQLPGPADQPGDRVRVVDGTASVQRR